MFIIIKTNILLNIFLTFSFNMFYLSKKKIRFHIGTFYLKREHRYIKVNILKNEIKLKFYRWYHIKSFNIEHDCHDWFAINEETLNFIFFSNWWKTYWWNYTYFKVFWMDVFNPRKNIFAQGERNAINTSQWFELTERNCSFKHSWFAFKRLLFW